MVRQLASQVRSMEEYISTLQSELLTLSATNSHNNDDNESAYKVTTPTSNCPHSLIKYSLGHVVSRSLNR